jgi:poly(3-hydroxybutyrate) depolymerase
MRSPASSAVLGALAVGLAAYCGCSSGGGAQHDAAAAGGGASGSLGSAGDGGGTAGAGASGTAGTSDAGEAETVDATDAIEAIQATDATDATETSEAADASGDGDGGATSRAITGIVPTIGCGIDPGQAGGTIYPYTIETSGTKTADCADSPCGPWMYTREYYVALPIGYENTKAYPLVFDGPGCGGRGNNIYTLNALGNGLAANDNVDNSVIHVGLTPPPNAIGAAVRPNQGCFDFEDGDNSVDWVFYERVYDQLAGLLCFDKNRVFVIGAASGGSSFANELGCKYAGDAKRPIRGMMAASGGLPLGEAPVLPTCSDNPMAGMWVEQTGDTAAPFTRIKFAVTRAMKVNGCTLGASYDEATWEDFPIGVEATMGNICKKVKGCPELTPLVVCPLAGNGHGTNPTVANPGFSTFIKLFQSPPLLTQ